MNYLAEICHLSAQFYADYPKSQYPEILAKISRPYSCLLIEYWNDLFLCIPYRSHVPHPYAYHFKNSARSKQNRSGLDYTKSILVQNPQYIETAVSAVVDQDEYKETIVNLPRIVQETYNYISDYNDDLNGVRKLHPKEWKRRYGRSTLPYFDNYLRDVDL
jgi:hypothetical protein